MEANDFLPPEGVQVSFCKCAGCGMISTQIGVIRLHQSAKCQGAAILKAKKWVVDKDVAQAQQGNTVNVNNGTNTVNVGTNNITINFPLDVVPVEHERDAIVDHLRQNIALLTGLFAPPRYDTMPARILHHTKGAAGPQPLQNVRVKGNHVFTKNEEHVGSQTIQKYAREIAAKLIEYAFEAAEEVLAEEPAALLDRRLHVAKQFMETAPAQNKDCAHTRYNALELFHADNHTFNHKLPVELKKFARNTLAATCNQLKSFSAA